MREGNDALKKAVAAHRSEIASLKRRIHALEAALKALGKARAGERAPARSARVEAQADAGDADRRFSAKGMASNRKRLGLSAADFGRLVGTTGQSVYAWEAGKSKPRPEAFAAIAALRGIGKREVAARLAALKD